MDTDLAFKLAGLRPDQRIGSRGSKVGDKEGHAQHQRDADNDDEDQESAHPCSSMRQEAPIGGRTFLSACGRALMSPFGKLHRQIAVSNTIIQRFESRIASG